MAKLTHIDEAGRSRMVDVSAKPESAREAVARGRVIMQSSTLELIEAGRVEKGNVFEVARVAGIMAAKATSALIPMCHPLGITSVEISFKPDKKKCSVEIESRVKVLGKTGVEMEALTAVAVSALTIYDMCKAADKGMTITDIRLMRKSGGKSGLYIRPE